MTTDVKATVLSKLADCIPDIDRAFILDTPTQLKDLQLDSLVVLEIVYDLEEHFRVTVSEAELRSLCTVNDLISIFDNNLKKAI